MHGASGCSLNILKFPISICHRIPKDLLPLSLLFLAVQFAFCLLALSGFLCSLLPLSGTNSCSQCVLFSGMSCCLVCVAAALGSPGQVSQGDEELERSLQCIPISPWKDTFWQGRWGSGSFPCSFISVFLTNPSASSFHLTVNDRRRVDPCKPAVPWQLCLGLVTLLRALEQDLCQMYPFPGPGKHPVKSKGHWTLCWEHAEGGSDWTIQCLSTEVVQFPSLKVFMSRLDKSLSNLA